MKKTLYLLLGLFIILISCSKSGEGPEPDEDPKNPLAPAKTYLGMLVTNAETGGYKLSTNSSGITMANITLGSNTFTLTNNIPLRNNETITLTDGSNSIKLGLDKFGKISTFKFTLPGHTKITHDFLELKTEGAVRVFTGTQNFLRKDNNEVDETYIGSLILNNDGKWQSIDRIDAINNTHNPNSVGDHLTSDGTYTENETTIDITAQNITLSFVKDGNKIVLMTSSFNNEVLVNAEYSKLALE